MYWTRLVLVRPAASLYSASPLKHHTTGQKIDVLHGFLASQNIRIEVLHKAVVKIWAGIYHSILFMVAVLDFCGNWPLGGDLNLLAGVSENLVPIPITMQNIKSWSQSAQFFESASPLL